MNYFKMCLLFKIQIAVKNLLKTINYFQLILKRFNPNIGVGIQNLYTREYIILYTPAIVIVQQIIGFGLSNTKN